MARVLHELSERFQTEQLLRETQLKTQNVEDNAKAIDSIAELVRAYRTLHERDPKHLEFELRLGTIKPGKFVSGVDTEAYHIIATHLQNFEGWDEDQSEALKASESVSTFYLNRQGHLTRTTSYLDHNGTMKKRHVYKEKIKHVDLQRRPVQHDVWGFDLRVALAREVPVASSQLPDLVNPSHVRIQQRNSYILGIFRFDLTITWSGKTKAEAENHQRTTGHTLFEIEVEILDGRAFLEMSNRRAAATLLFKARDLLALIDNTPLVHVPIQTKK